VEYCRRHPQSLLLGVEVKGSRCLKAQSKIEKRSLTNALVVKARAEEVLPLLPSGSVSSFHLYFPDPWPKSKHRRRRFLRAENVERLYAALKPEGRIVFVTDFHDYHLQARVLFALHPGLQLCPEEPPEEAFISVYGRKYRELGKTVHSATARKLG
jgi:tRNA (guanine-N7-)-methyltransferase